ncbi:MAG: hypothetical protein Q7Q71_05045 [Verrucomicrobiota bacterium JB023]|nr:hypothetical protein [Verrucomicrobiota bacterium JB023]
MKSRGGEILLDGEFFEKGYANNRIEDVFFNLRQTKRIKGGFFITMQTAIPTCNTDPSFNEIRKRYGEPDFVQTGSERNTLSKYSGNEADDDPNIVTYFYDYFGFEVNQSDPDSIVERVVTHAHDLSKIRPKDKEPSFAQISMKNLTVFSNNSEEVGRIYYFLEGQKEPLSIKEPPIGKYRRGNEVLEFLGDGKWKWTTYFENETVAHQIPFEEHRMNGKAEGYHSDGTPSFVAFYKDGVLDGKLVKYSEKGDILEETVFVNGQPQEHKPKQ